MARQTRAERNRFRTDGNYCYRCGEKLAGDFNTDAVTYLVLGGGGRFYATDDEADATGHNQGGWAFGPTCAKRQLAETKREG